MVDGMKVVANPNWEWGTQNEYSKYGILSLDAEEEYTINSWVTVRWLRHTGLSSAYGYRIGCDGHYDLCIYDESEFITLDGKIRKNANSN